MAEYTAGTAKIVISPNLTGFQNKAKRELEAIKLSHDVLIEPDVTNFREKLQAALRDAHLTVNVDADTTAAITRIDAATRNRTTTVNVDADTTAAQAQVNSVAGNRTTTVNVDADTAAAEAQLSTLARRRDVDIDVDVNAASALGASAAIGLVGTTASMTSGRVVLLSSAIATLAVTAAGAVGPLAAMGSVAITAGGALMVLPAAASAAVAGIAALGIGLSGIGGAFQAMGASAGAAGADTSQAVKGAQRQVEDAARGVERAQRQVEDATRRVADAERDVSDAQKNSLKAQRDLNDARAEASDELRDMNQQLRDAALDEEGAALAVARARERLAETNADPGSSQLDQAEANLAYRRAISNLEETRRKNNELAEDVQKANDAGVEGSERVTDAKDQVEQASRREEDAQRSLVEAHQGVADAQENVIVAQERLADALDSLAGAGAGAAGGVDQFAEALANLAPNAQAFVLAMQALGGQWRELRLEVQDNLFEGLGESVTTLANTQLPILQSGLASISTEINQGLRANLSALSSEASQTGLENLLSNSAVGLDSMNAAAGPLAQAMMDISSAGSNYLPALGEAIGDAGSRFADFLSASTENGQFDQWVTNGTAAMQSMGSTLADTGGIISGVWGAAAAAGESSLGPMATALEMTNEWVNSVQGQEALGAFFSSMTDALAALMPTLSIALNSIGSTIMPAISDFLQSAAPGLELLIQGLADGLSALAPSMGPLGEAFGAILGALAPLGPVIGELATAAIVPLAGVITDLAVALEPVIGMLAASLTPVIEQLAPMVADFAGLFAGVLVQALSAVAPFLPQLVDAFGQILIAVMPLIPLLLDLVIKIFVPLLPAVVALLPVIVQLVSLFANIVVAVMPVVTVLVQLIGIFAQIIATVVGFVATIIAQFISMATAVLGSVTGLIVSIIGGWNSMIATIIGIVVSWASDMLNRFNQMWANLSNAVSSGIGQVVRLTSEIGTKIVDVFKDAGRWLVNAGKSIISGLWDGMKDMWKNASEWFSNSLGSIRNPFSRNATGSVTNNASGSIATFATGGEDHQPQYAPPGAWRVWAEDETGGELYIPLADDHRRGRAEALLTAGAHHFGLEVIDPATGQPYNSGYSGNLAPTTQHFADGGVTIDELDDLARQVDGQPYVLGGPHWGDCSQTQSILSRFATTGQVLMQRAFTTVNQGPVLSQMGFYRGIGSPGDFQIGWWDQGGGVNGHTASTLPTGVNVEMGGYPSRGHYGGSGVGAGHSQFTDHAHLPRSFFEEIVVPAMGPLGDLPDYAVDSGQPLEQARASGATDPDSYASGGGATSGPTTWSDIAGNFAQNFVSGQVEDALGVIGLSNNLPPAMLAWQEYQQAIDNAGTGGSRTSAINDISTVSGAAASAIATDPSMPTATVTGAQVIGLTSLDEIAAPQDDGQIGHIWDPAAGAEQWRGMAMEAMRRTGFDANSPAQINAMIAQISSESGGNPGIAQQIVDINGTGESAGVGLLQIIPGTFEAHRDPELPNDRRDPFSNMVAALRYYRSRYGGDLTTTWGKGMGYWSGGSVWGNGGPLDDVIPAMLANGEVVVREQSARFARPLLERINADPGFARQAAGMLSGTLPTTSTTPTPQGAQVHYHIQTNDLTEAMRRTEMHSRRQVMAMAGL